MPRASRSAPPRTDSEIRLRASSSGVTPVNCTAVRTASPGSPAGTRLWSSRSSGPGSTPNSPARTSRPPVSRQRLRPPAIAIKRQHQQRVQALAHRVLGGEGLQLAYTRPRPPPCAPMTGPATRRSRGGGHLPRPGVRWVARPDGRLDELTSRPGRGWPRLPTGPCALSREPAAPLIVDHDTEPAQPDRPAALNRRRGSLPGAVRVSP